MKVLIRYNNHYAPSENTTNVFAPDICPWHVLFIDNDVTVHETFVHNVTIIGYSETTSHMVQVYGKMIPEFSIVCYLNKAEYNRIAEALYDNTFDGNITIFSTVPKGKRIATISFVPDKKFSHIEISTGEITDYEMANMSQGLPKIFSQRMIKEAKQEIGENCTDEQLDAYLESMIQTNHKLRRSDNI